MALSSKCMINLVLIKIAMNNIITKKV